MQLGVLRTAQAVSGLVFVFSLVVLAFFAGQYSITGFSVAEEDAVEQGSLFRTYTKAVCEDDGQFIRCQDRLFMEIDGVEIEADGMPLGSTVLES